MSLCHWMRRSLITVACLAMCACAPAPQQPEKRVAEAPKAMPKPPDTRPVIVAFGDSLSAGFGADPGKSFPDFLQKEIDRAGYRYRVINAGISGETSTDAVARLNTVTAMKPAVVIVEFGGNDGLRGLPVATTESNLEQIIGSLKQSGAQVLLAGMTLPPNYGPDYIRSFQRIYTDLAARDHVALIPFLLQG